MTYDAEPSLAPHQAVGAAIQNLAAARVGRGFVPLGLLFVAGVAEILLLREAATHGVALVLGAAASAGAMLAYALRAVQRAFGRDHRPWMTWALVGSLVPPVFALYVLGWRGLRTLALGGGAAAWAVGGVMTLLGAWFLRRWLKVVEIQRLADTMADLGS